MWTLSCQPSRTPKVSVFHDPWLLRPKHFLPISLINLSNNHLDDTRGGWDWNKINSVLWEVDREEVKRILQGSNNGEDRMIWHYTFHDEYMVKSGYDPSVKWWRRKYRIPQQWRVFFFITQVPIFNMWKEPLHTNAHVHYSFFFFFCFKWKLTILLNRPKKTILLDQIISYM